MRTYTNHFAREAAQTFALPHRPSGRQTPGMLKYFLLIGLLIPNPESQAADLCSPLNHCVIEKQTWGKKGWKSDYRKELDFENFCGHERPQLQAEEELGLELWIFPGEEKNAQPIKQKPYLTLNLHTYKLTHVVASASAPATAEALSLSYRLSPRGKSLVEVSCWKK